MTVILTLLLIICLELAGLYLASGLGQAIRNAFRKTDTSKRSPRLRALDVIIGYTAIFGVFGLLTLVL